ncbi:MAG TPA: hypothetical protein VF587_16900 [Solirubrobacteraceae bacterium]|jgi:hypothetical protein
MTDRVRRLGFGTALATGLSLVALSFGGMATLDADLRAASEQRQTDERVVIEKHDCPRDRRRGASDSDI